MPKIVEVPDGTEVEFPDEMSDDAISAVLRKQFGAPASPAAGPPASPGPPQDETGAPPEVEMVSDAADATWRGVKGFGKGLTQLAAGAGEAVRSIPSLPGPLKGSIFDAPGMIRQAGEALADATVGGEQTPPAEGPLSQRIKGVQEAAGAVPEGRAEEVGAFAGKALPFLAAAPASIPAAGAMNAGLTTLEGGDPLEAGISGAFGAAGQAVAKPLASAGGWLARKAVAQYGKALNPTKEALKVRAEKIIPELLDRGVTGSLRSLEARGNVGRKIFGKKIGAAVEDASQAGKTINAVDLADELDALKQTFIGQSSLTPQQALQQALQAGTVSGSGGRIAVPSGKVPFHEGAIAAIEDIQGKLRALGDAADPADLWKFKRVLNDVVNQSNGFTKTLGKHTAASIRKDGAAAIRRGLDSAVPDLQKLNLEFGLWKDLENVARSTASRQTGQQGPITEKMARATLFPLFGAAVGGGEGYRRGGWGGAAEGAAVGAALTSVIRTPAWRTTSAVAKNRLAKALAYGDTSRAIRIIGQIAASASGQIDDEQPIPEGLAEARRRRQLQMTVGNPR